VVTPDLHPAPSPEPAALLAQGRRLEHLTIAWNALEAAASLAAGILAGSIALVGFGLDSVLETFSAIVLLWRLRPGIEPQARERIESKAHRWVGVCFLALAAYIAVESVWGLWQHLVPEKSILGIAIAVAAIMVMPMLATSKRRIAEKLGSRALRSDSRQADFCAYLSATLLVGLMLNWLVGWWWADAVAALVMVPVIVVEGVDGLRGKGCADCTPKPE